jgi:hypothetical protein
VNESIADWRMPIAELEAGGFSVVIPAKRSASRNPGFRAQGMTSISHRLTIAGVTFPSWE